MTSSVTDVVLSLTVPSIYFLTIENWCKAPLKILASLFRGSHGLFGFILVAPLRDRWHGVLEGHRKFGKLIIPIHGKGDRSECTNYWGISVLNLPGKVYVKCFAKRYLAIIEPKLDDTQCGFRHGHSTTEQNSTLQQILEKSWEHRKDVYTCFVDLGKLYERVPREKLWGAFRECGVDGHLLLAAK